MLHCKSPGNMHFAIVSTRTHPKFMDVRYIKNIIDTNMVHIPFQAISYLDVFKTLHRKKPRSPDGANYIQYYTF